MKLKLISFAVIFIAAICIFISCSKKPNDLTPVATTLDVSNTASNATFTLGRVLFYDTHLSVNGAIACASCHNQAIAFSDNVSLSRGFENRLTVRNTLPIQNLESFSFRNPPIKLFWDGRVSFLNTMVVMPILNHVEMGMSDGNALVERVKSVPYYKELFNKAYNTSAIDLDKISSALAEFVGGISSQNTRFDLFMGGKETLTAIEQQGHDLFFTKYNCNSCHQTQSLNGYQNGGGDSISSQGFINIGLDAVYADNGLGKITGNTADNGKFKIPNLRNVALTAPYMHDGRFKTLDEVMEHYSHGIADHPNLDSRLKKNGMPVRMNITAQEKTALIAFLNALTDYRMITDSRLSSPFKTQ